MIALEAIPFVLGTVGSIAAGLWLAVSAGRRRRVQRQARRDRLQVPVSPTETSIELARAVARAHDQRAATLEPALGLFREATTESQQAHTAANLMAVTAQADVDFQRAVSRARDVMETRDLAELTRSGKPESGGR